MLLVEAAGVEPDKRIENTQLVDSEIAKIGMNSTISNSTVRSLYSLFQEFPELPNPTFGQPHFAKEHSEVQS